MRKLCLALAFALAGLASGATAQTPPTPAPPSLISTQPDLAALRLAAIEERERHEAIQREKDDLTAQQKMAVSANSLLRPSWWQVFIGAAGFLGLLGSLAFTYFSLRQTQAALSLQQNTSEQGLRAYLGIDKYDLTDFAPGKAPTIAVTFKNYGQTPAFKVIEKQSVKIIPKGGEPNFDVDGIIESGTLNPGEENETFASLGILTPAAYARFKGAEPSDGDIVSVVGEAVYTTFGTQRTLRYAIHFHGPGAAHHLLVPGQNWSD